MVQQTVINEQVSRIIDSMAMGTMDIQVILGRSEKLPLIDQNGKVVFSSGTSLLTVDSHSLSTLHHLLSSQAPLQPAEYLVSLKLDHLVFSLDYLASLGAIHQKQHQALFLYDSFYKPGFSILSLEALGKLSSKLSFIDIINNSIKSREMLFNTYDHGS